jgi:hypothetical protein
VGAREDIGQVSPGGKGAREKVAEKREDMRSLQSRDALTKVLVAGEFHAWPLVNFRASSRSPDVVSQCVRFSRTYSGSGTSD